MVVVTLAAAVEEAAVGAVAADVVSSHSRRG